MGNGGCEANDREGVKKKEIHVHGYDTVVAVIVSADMAVQCSNWFPTNSCTWFTHTDTCTCCIRVHGPCAHRPP